MESNHETTLYPLLIVSLLAFVIPIFTAWFSKTIRLTIPAIVGEIICGIIIGKSLLGLIPSTNSIQWLEFLSLFGFTYLMFLCGLEIDFGLITSENAVSRKTLKTKNLLKKPLILAFCYFMFNLFLASLASFLLFTLGYLTEWFYIALIFATVSVGIVLPVLKENDILKTYFGQITLICALVSDFLTMVLITIFITLQTQQKGSIAVIAIILAILTLSFIYRLHISKTFDRVIKLFAALKPIFKKLTHSTTQINVRGAIALMVTFIVLSQFLGIEVILGAFIAGILISLILGKTDSTELNHKLDTIGYGFFIPIFFICVGIDLDLKVFFSYSSALTLLFLLIFFAFTTKIIPAILFSVSFNPKESLSLGIILSSTLSLPIAAATIGVKAGIISEELNVSIILMAIVTCIIAPIAFNILFKPSSEKEKNKIAIIGANYPGRIIALNLINQKQKIVLAALNLDEYHEAKKMDLPVFQTSLNISQTFESIDINKIKAVIASTDNDEFNLSICLNARNNYNIKNLYSVVNDCEKIDESKNLDLYNEQNIIPVSKSFSVAENIVNRILSPDTAAIFSRKSDDINLADVILTNKDFHNVPLYTVRLPGNTLIVYIRRNEEKIIPHGSTFIFENDHLTLIGTPEAVIESINLLGVAPD